MATTHPMVTFDPSYRAGGFALALAAGAILAAIGFERIGGYEPCPLCLMQRYAYYAGIPALFFSMVLVTMGQNRVAALAFFAVSLMFLANAGLGVYHAGAEWKFWPGPDTCAATARELSTGAGSLLKDLEKVRVIRCDEAPWTFAGLSFAGWNVVLSFVIFVASLQAASAAARR